MILKEMPDNRMDSLCCGGGGGRVWMETQKGERFGDLRMDQAMAVEAEQLVTACPYCITMFEDSRITMGIDEKLKLRTLRRSYRKSCKATP